MEPIKVYVIGKEKADVICPSCSKANVILFADTDMSQNCEIECSCTNTILVIFEKRRSFRRRVLLTGTCFSKSDPPEGTTVKISNLSRTGVQFLKDTGEKLELNETIRVRFRPKLSNNVIRCTALVKNIDGNSIGVKFLNLDLNAQKLIG
ncbi:MAG: PilZ domain-containing protein [Syntrophobacteraceae bacterium]